MLNTDDAWHLSYSKRFDTALSQIRVCLGSASAKRSRGFYSYRLNILIIRCANRERLNELRYKLEQAKGQPLVYIGAAIRYNIFVIKLFYHEPSGALRLFLRSSIYDVCFARRVRKRDKELARLKRDSNRASALMDDRLKEFVDKS